MSIEVIGAGFGRTGTLSLKYALEHLGYNKCYHMLEVRNHPDHTDLWRAAHLGKRSIGTRCMKGIGQPSTGRVATFGQRWLTLSPTPKSSLHCAMQMPGTTAS